MSGLEGQVVIVTGSSAGIGEATCRAFAEEGCRVVVSSVSSVEAGTAVAKSLPDAIYVQGNVAVENDCKALVAAAMDKWGRLDVLVNNASTTQVIPHADLDAVTEDLWRHILDVNVVGQWFMSRAATPALKADGGGNIINVSSVAGVRASGSSIPYAVSKAALNHLTLILAKVLAPDIRVNAVLPGLIDTPRTTDWDTQRANVVANAPLQRTGTSEDIAKICLFLTQAEYCTGELVRADGGMHL